MDPDPQRALIERTYLRERPYSLAPEHREIVLRVVQEVCFHRGWTLHAAHVRSTHIHIIAESDLRPEAMMNAFKAYASRALNRSCGDDGPKLRWARHGSTRWLWNADHVRAAVDYVASGQGEPMSVFLAEW